MADWKKRFIVAGVLFVITLIIFFVKTTGNKNEAGQISSGKIVTDSEAFSSSLKEDGVIYAKGKIEGKVRNDEITIYNKKISYDPKDMIEGEEPFIKGDLIWVEVSVGEYEYNKRRYEESSVMEHSYSEDDILSIQADKITILGQEIDISQSPNFVDKLYMEKVSVSDGSLIYDNKLKVTVPIKEHRDDLKYYDGYKVRGIYSGLDAILKVEVKDGKIVNEETKAFGEKDFEELEEIAKTGDINYAVEIPAYILVWAFFTGIAWIGMKFILLM